MTDVQLPARGATIRMYRQGHGDCFLLAFPRRGEAGSEAAEERPVFVLIDCGYKPGSKVVPGSSIGDVAKDITAATGGRLDLAVITHEHQDHVNGIWKKTKPYFGDLAIDEAWFAWTEDPADELADRLRAQHKDQLLSLAQARQKLAAAPGADRGVLGRIDALLALETGGDTNDRDPGFGVMLGAAKDPEGSTNKQAMKLIKDKAAEGRGVRYLSPDGEPIEIPGTGGVRVYVLGPPRNPDLLSDEEPVGDELFDRSHGGAHGFSFGAAAQSGEGGSAAPSPFSRRYHVPKETALKGKAGGGFFQRLYGSGSKRVAGELEDQAEAPDGATWRRIDAEWLYAAEALALKMNSGINNTSLVLAFELPESKKVLLFAGDAQRGNWISWDDQTWTDGDDEVTARDLLGRTVLYKVGHHGSHNATLNGDLDKDYPNLSWMGQGEHAGEFTAMITAVNEWALTKNDPPWVHPLPSIKEALVRKAQGRVLQTDTWEPEKPDDVSDAAWTAFRDRLRPKPGAKKHPLAFELEVRDE